MLLHIKLTPLLLKLLDCVCLLQLNYSRIPFTIAIKIFKKNKKTKQVDRLLTGEI